MEPQQNIQGNLVQDPTQTVVATGLRVTKFRMASSGRRFDNKTNDWVTTPPVYITVNCWRQLGDNVYQSLSKGDRVIVMGRLTYREWDDAQGNRRERMEIEATAVGPDLSKYVVSLSRPLRELPDHGDEPAAPDQRSAPATEAVAAQAEVAA